MAAGTTIESSYQSAPVAAKRSRSSMLPLFVTFAAFLVVCVPLSKYLNIWQDEAYSLHSTSGSFVDAFHQGLGFEAQAPLYFVALSIWRSIYDSAFFARLLSVAFSLATIAVSWQFARRYIKNVDPSYLTGIVAFNPLIVWAAVEMRPYAASITASALLLLAFFRGYLDDRPSRSARIAYLCVGIIGAYTQYYVAFLLPAHLFALLMLRRWSSVKLFLVNGFAFVVALIPLVAVIPRQLQSYHAFSVAFVVPSYAMLTVLLGYPFPHGWINSWAREPFHNFCYAVSATVPLALGVKHLPKIGTVTRALGYVLIALFAMYTLVILAHVQVLIPRHTLVMLVPILACVVALIGDVELPRRRLVLSSYLTIYSLFAVLSISHDYRDMSKIGDWHRVSEYIENNLQPGDGIALFDAEAELPFRYYFKPAVPVMAIPRSMSFNEFDEDTFVLRRDADVAQPLGRFAVSLRRIWLVENEACLTHETFFGCKYLTKYIDRHFRVVTRTRFNGSIVIQLRPRG